MELFRGDDRPPSEIKRDGFTPKNWKNSRVPGPQTKDALSKLQSIPIAMKAPKDLGAYITYTKDPDLVSFAESEIGSYDNYAYVYKLSFDSTEMSLSAAGVKVTRNSNSNSNSKWPTILIDADTTAKATLLAVRLNNPPTNEVTFFTRIPPESITHWKKGGTQPNNWQSMNSIQPDLAKKLW